ncbi:hypothetical protein GIB67_038409 [Kingdonia uniflora]|uniref:Mitochondrial import inner membrane translocase subunit Tim21 n=1 Tax=Kingdonia uniflora TaxID=39325 RepID=A0A7J7NPN4_9MAGN|nr:hypothetical protein GIB67_038409 [Kingdonia uniflora]
MASSRVFNASRALMAAAAPKAPSGIMKAYPVSPALRKFLGGVPEASRTHVVKQIWVHIKDQKLQVANRVSKTNADITWMEKDVQGVNALPVMFGVRQTGQCIVSPLKPYQLSTTYRADGLPHSVRSFASSSAYQSSGKAQQEKGKDLSTFEDPFDAPTYNIPQKPVTFTEGASYSVVILAGLGIAAAAGYATFKELIFEPKEYKIFGKALERVQNDSQVRARIGSPITGYGQESRNRSARQRIPNRTWTDEDGIEKIQINFYIRGPHGAGKVDAEMFKDKMDKKWKYTYLIVDLKSPSPVQLMLESYVPA